jgi:small multidrug resistance pump
MSFVSTVCVLGAVLCNVGASLLIKTSASTHDAAAGSQGFLANGLIATAIALYGASFVFYALVLRELDVSKAYALITFGTQVVLVAAAALVLGERLDTTTYAGLGVILVGVIIVAQGARVG